MEHSVSLIYSHFVSPQPASLKNPQQLKLVAITVHYGGKFHTIYLWNSQPQDDVMDWPLSLLKKISIRQLPMGCIQLKENGHD